MKALTFFLRFWRLVLFWMLVLICVALLSGCVVAPYPIATPPPVPTQPPAPTPVIITIEKPAPAQDNWAIYFVGLVACGALFIAVCCGVVLYMLSKKPQKTYINPYSMPYKLVVIDGGKVFTADNPHEMYNLLIAKGYNPLTVPSMLQGARIVPMLQAPKSDS